MANTPAAASAATTPEKPGRAVSDSDVPRMPWEQGGRPKGGDSDSLLAFLESDESDTPGAHGGKAPGDAGADSGHEPQERGSEEQDDVEQPGEEHDDTLQQTFTVKVEGKDVAVTLEELTAGYSRTADYTRKSMALAEQRKQVEGAAQQVQTVRDQYAARLAALEDALKDFAPEEPDWDKLRNENPAEFAARWADHQRYQQDRAAVQAERAREAADAQAAFEQEMQRVLAGERERLLEALPEWKDEIKAAEGRKALVEYGRGLGFTVEQIGSVTDHRLIVLLHKAAKYDEITTKGRQTLEDKRRDARVLEPGARGAGGARGGKATAREVAHRIGIDKLKKTGRTRDAVAVIENLLPDDF